MGTKNKLPAEEESTRIPSRILIGKRLFGSKKKGISTYQSRRLEKVKQSKTTTTKTKTKTKTLRR